MKIHSEKKEKLLSQPKPVLSRGHVDYPFRTPQRSFAMFATRVFVGLWYLSVKLSSGMTLFKAYTWAHTIHTHEDTHTHTLIHTADNSR